MKPMTLGEFALRAGGEVRHVDPDRTFSAFALDSRQVLEGDLFLAIQGANVDGHEFVPQVMAAGASAAVVERECKTACVVVPNLVEALAAFASTLRDEFVGPVVGITGSNGKTTTKEFAAAALAPLGGVLKSEGNRNTEYTAPLLWAELSPEHRVVVTELAMRGTGQIAHLARFARPTIGIVTMIGTAHLEMVGSREALADAKAELIRALPSNGTAILWAEDDFLSYLAQQAPCQVRTFGFSDDANCRIIGYRALDWSRSACRGSLDGRSFEAELGAVGRHQALNAAAALLAATSCGVDLADAAGALISAQLPPMRMEVIEWNGAMILMDSYNASPDSTVAAIRTLCELPAKGRRMAVLGEMKELGAFSESGHRQVGKAVALAMLDDVTLYGGETRHLAEEAVGVGFPAERLHQALSIEDVRRFLSGVGPGDVVLVKGSRALGLESALSPLREVHR